MRYSREFILDNLDNAITETEINFGKKIQGKVRDSYVKDDKRLLVATDRLSAFDRILTSIPFKGEILTELSLFWFKNTEDIISNHIIKKIAPAAILVHNCRLVPLEVIVRGYLTGSLWRRYKAGEEFEDFEVPKGAKEYYKFVQPLICFTTKGAPGEHDEPLTHREVIKRGLLSEDELELIVTCARKLYARGNEIVSKKDLILVDTKYEFGKLNEQLTLIDEIHTQDSSRYILKKQFETNGKIEELDKEYFRKWLMAQSYMGDGEAPKITDEIRVEVFFKYLEAFQKITSENLELGIRNKKYNILIMEQLKKEGCL